MSEELYFNDELRKCLNAAGLSDCGENDAWNYWYQRVYKAHNQTIDRVTEVQRAENARLRELVEKLYKCTHGLLRDLAPSCVDSSIEGCGMDCTENGENCCMALLEHHMHELGVETN